MLRHFHDAIFRVMSSCLNVSDKKYPPLLKSIHNPPKKLYVKGTSDLSIFENCVAVVGSRRMTPYGKKVVNHLLSTFSKQITVVSGFMFGVDAEAHSVALDCGLRTIAIMPCGINVIHPSYQFDLYNRILNSNGLILSEFEGDIPPRIWTYPKRNRIVAGLCKATVIIEAGENSGSLITAHFANSFGRKVFAVPSNIFSESSKGISQILKLFANTLSSGCEINEFMGLPGRLVTCGVQKNVLNNSEIVEILKNEPQSIDELSENLKMPVTKLSTFLTILVMEGLIYESGGIYYAN